MSVTYWLTDGTATVAGPVEANEDGSVTFPADSFRTNDRPKWWQR